MQDRVKKQVAALDTCMQEEPRYVWAEWDNCSKYTIKKSLSPAAFAGRSSAGCREAASLEAEGCTQGT